MLMSISWKRNVERWNLCGNNRNSIYQGMEAIQFIHQVGASVQQKNHRMDWRFLVGVSMFTVSKCIILLLEFGKRWNPTNWIQ